MATTTTTTELPPFLPKHRACWRYIGLLWQLRGSLGMREGVRGDQECDAKEGTLFEL